MLMLALGLTAAANARLCCEIYVDGQALDGLYAPCDVALSRHTAMVAAEEILRESVVPPSLETHYTLSFSKPKRQTAQLSDALLRATKGVAVTHGVYLGGERMGAVEDERELRSRLYSFITNQLPSWAVSGDISKKLELYEEYSRVGQAADCDDMVLLICGTAPVFYSDGNGYISRA